MTTTSPAPASHVVPACPCCGARIIHPDAAASSLLGVCDILVIKTLEQIGKRIVRAEGRRRKILAARPFHEAHTLWPATDTEVSKALRRAWDVVPAMLDSHGCCGLTPVQVTGLLDGYVHDLVITGTPHTLDELASRFTDHLGLPVTTRDGPA